MNILELLEDEKRRTTGQVNPNAVMSPPPITPAEPSIPYTTSPRRRLASLPQVSELPAPEQNPAIDERIRSRFQNSERAGNLALIAQGLNALAAVGSRRMARVQPETQKAANILAAGSLKFAEEGDDLRIRSTQDLFDEAQRRKLKNFDIDRENKDRNYRLEQAGYDADFEQQSREYVQQESTRRATEVAKINKDREESVAKIRVAAANANASKAKSETAEMTDADRQRYAYQFARFEELDAMFDDPESEIHNENSRASKEYERLQKDQRFMDFYDAAKGQEMFEALETAQKQEKAKVIIQQSAQKATGFIEDYEKSRATPSQVAAKLTLLRSEILPELDSVGAEAQIAQIDTLIKIYTDLARTADVKKEQMPQPITLSPSGYAQQKMVTPGPATNAAQVQMPDDTASVQQPLPMPDRTSSGASGTYDEPIPVPQIDTADLEAFGPVRKQAQKVMRLKKRYKETAIAGVGFQNPAKSVLTDLVQAAQDYEKMLQDPAIIDDALLSIYKANHASTYAWRSLSNEEKQRDIEIETYLKSKRLLR